MSLHEPPAPPQPKDTICIHSTQPLQQIGLSFILIAPSRLVVVLLQLVKSISQNHGRPFRACFQIQLVTPNCCDSSWQCQGHVFGKPTRKESCFDNLHISRNAWDTNLVKVQLDAIWVFMQSLITTLGQSWVSRRQLGSCWRRCICGHTTERERPSTRADSIVSRPYRTSPGYRLVGRDVMHDAHSLMTSGTLSMTDWLLLAQTMAKFFFGRFLKASRCTAMPKSLRMSRL